MLCVRMPVACLHMHTSSSVVYAAAPFPRSRDFLGGGQSPEHALRAESCPSAGARAPGLSLCGLRQCYVHVRMCCHALELCAPLGWHQCMWLLQCALHMHGGHPGRLHANRSRTPSHKPATYGVSLSRCSQSTLFLDPVLCRHLQWPIGAAPIQASFQSDHKLHSRCSRICEVDISR